MMQKSFWYSLLFVAILSLVPSLEAHAQSAFSPLSRGTLAASQGDTLSMGALQSPPLGTSRIAHKTLAGSLMSPFSLGTLSQGQISAGDQWAILTWGVGIPLLILDVFLISMTIRSFMVGHGRFLWGLLSVIAGGLTLVWALVPFAYSDFSILFGVPTLIVGTITVVIGAIALSRAGRFHRRRYYRPYYGVAPWFNVGPNGDPRGGMAVFGQF